MAIQKLGGRSLFLRRDSRPQECGADQCHRQERGVLPHEASQRSPY